MPSVNQSLVLVFKSCQSLPLIAVPILHHESAGESEPHAVRACGGAQLARIHYQKHRPPHLRRRCGQNHATLYLPRSNEVNQCEHYRFEYPSSIQDYLVPKIPNQPRKSYRWHRYKCRSVDQTDASMPASINRIKHCRGITTLLPSRGGPTFEHLTLASIRNPYSNMSRSSNSFTETSLIHDQHRRELPPTFCPT